MTINTKFDVGDRVWLVHQTRQPVQTSYMCPVCNGTGRMKVFGKKCDASILGGQYRCYNGYFSSNEPVYQVYSDIVTDIYYNISDKNEAKDITYTLKKGIDSWTTMFDEECLFATKEEAQAKCDKENESNKGV